MTTIGSVIYKGGLELVCVYFNGKRSIVWCKRDGNGQFVLPTGKSSTDEDDVAGRCFSRGFYERMSDHSWNDLEWLSKEEADNEGLNVAWEHINK